MVGPPRLWSAVALTRFGFHVDGLSLEVVSLCLSWHNKDGRTQAFRPGRGARSSDIERLETADSPCCGGWLVPPVCPGVSSVGYAGTHDVGVHAGKNSSSLQTRVSVSRCIQRHAHESGLDVLLMSKHVSDTSEAQQCSNHRMHFLCTDVLPNRWRNKCS